MKLEKEGEGGVVPHAGARAPIGEAWSLAAISSAPAAMAPQVDEDVALLLRAGIAPALVAEALPQARRTGVPVHRVLLAEGMVADDGYVAALAGVLGPGVATWRERRTPAGATRFVGATMARPTEVRRRCSELRAQGVTPVLVATRRLGDVERPGERRQRLVAAANGLRRSQPQLSAGLPTPAWQKVAAVSLIGLILGGFAVTPQATTSLVLALLALPFFAVVVLRVLALGLLLTAGGPPRRPAGTIPDHELPSYAVLVPLYHEATVVAGLVAALARIDYPAAKLDIVLVLEAGDIETRAAVELIELPPYMRRVIVPDALPRTKPKALNFALSHAVGQMVVVYDAEDIPEPDQLRRAVALMRSSPAPIACAQARLAIDNGGEGLLARQFALEYTALFDALLPALSRLAIPVPLGGTSNHFPRSVLETVGGWDPFNVTEDAELGMRLARRRLAVEVLDSTTWEEAPTGLGQWLRQRTRWIKGWMQTWLVQMRDPVTSARELGMGGFVGLQVLMGGLVLSALVHPLFYLLAALEFVRETPFARPDGGIAAAVWIVAGFNLAAGYGSAMLLAAVVAVRRRRYGELLAVPLMPLYWLLISLAAYRALMQLARAPHLWEKTAHGSRQRSAAARRPPGRADRRA
ncbi:MAG: glycosyltransferase [Hyphomicrobiaceae bacterium]